MSKRANHTKTVAVPRVVDRLGLCHGHWMPGPRVSPLPLRWYSWRCRNHHSPQCARLPLRRHRPRCPRQRPPWRRCRRHALEVGSWPCGQHRGRRGRRQERQRRQRRVQEAAGATAQRPRGRPWGWEEMRIRGCVHGSCPVFCPLVCAPIRCPAQTNGLVSGNVEARVSQNLRLKRVMPFSRCESRALALLRPSPPSLYPTKCDRTGSGGEVQSADSTNAPSHGGGVGVASSVEAVALDLDAPAAT